MGGLWHEISLLVLAHPVEQGAGLVALVVTCLAYQARTTRGIALRLAVSSFFWTAHLFLLGAWSGGLLNLIALARGSVYSQRGERGWASHPFWPWLFWGLCIVAAAWAGLVKREGPRILFSTMAQSICCYALWTSRVLFARYLLVLASLFWLGHDVLAGSIPGAVCESLSLVSLLVAIVRDIVASHRPRNILP